MDLSDQSGRVAIVTGANSGLGLATTARLTTAGATVIMACRNLTKAEQARAGLAHRDRAVVARLDVADPASIESFSAEFLADHDRLDLLVNNAGVMMTPATLTGDGIELQWATNLLGPFALTGRLLGPLTATDGSRVVAVGSLAALSGTLTGHDPTSLTGYGRFEAYAASKLGDLVFAVELGRRLSEIDAVTVSAAAHPGLTHTNLVSGLEVPGLKQAAMLVSRLVAQPANAGAEPILAASCAPGVGHGSYFGPAGRRQHRGRAVEVALPPAALDSALGARLWEQSVELSGVDYLR